MQSSPVIIRSKRKTISIKVTPNATVEVRAPKQATQSEIDRILTNHAHWIEKNVQKSQKRVQELSYATFENGSYLYYLGERLEISFVPLYQKAIEVTDKIYINEKYAQNSKKIILAWYKRVSRITIEKRVKELATQNTISVGKVRLSTAQTQWGSCSGKDTLSISWRLIMAPNFVLDYVIIHELAHVKHKNHSDSFWNYVEKMYPDYKIGEKWLKNKGHLLNI